MKGSKLPVYGLVAVIALAIIYSIVNPPSPDLPGPIGSFPTWKSISARGQMTAQATNLAGTMWAGAWSQKDGDTSGQSAVHVIDFNGFAAKGIDLGNDTSVQCLSWAGDNTVRVVYAGPGTALHVAYIDGQSGKKIRNVPLETRIENVLTWPEGLDKFAAVTSEDNKSLKMAVLSDSGKIVGKEVAFDLPKDAALDSGAGLAADGSSFLFAVSDPAAKDGRSFYLADTKTGAVKKAFDLGDIPGRIEGIWPSAAGVLLVCKVKDKMQDVVYDTASGKLTSRPGGIDLKEWPAAPKNIAFTGYDGGYQFDVATGKTTTIFDSSKRTSTEEKGWRDFLRDSRLYKLKNGNYITVSETGGVTDIHELKPDGRIDQSLLSRI